MRDHRDNRRVFLRSGGLSLGAAALATLMNRATASDFASGAHQTPRARNIISLHMIGAPSQLDLFDHKPELVRRNGEACPESLLAGRRFAFIGDEKRLAGSRYSFAQRGHSGQVISELLPHLASVADELAVIRTVRTEEINHAPAQMFLHTGSGRGGRPALGAWVTYGLGAESRNLPAYVVLQSGPIGGAGTSLWSSGFLPSVHQGIPFRNQGDPVLSLSNPPGHAPASRRRLLDAVGQLNRISADETGDPEIATRIAQYELAFRMQMSVPELTDLTGETRQTLEMYGASPGKASFANNCLLARRLVERGVRIVELYDSDWDHHADLDQRLPQKCRDVDQAMAALIRDLKQRGMLDETLIVWGGEFGRTPLAQGLSGDGTKTRPGRDHHIEAFTLWLAGGGIRPGISYGQTDELGFAAVENPVSIHDVNATLLYQLGFDHERLTYRYQGREFRLTDVHGQVLTPLLA